jgi:hypothetical protein
MMEHLYTAKLLRKDNHDELDSILVTGVNKHHAIERAREEFAARAKDFWHYAYVWVEIKTENIRAV